MGKMLQRPWLKGGAPINLDSKKPTRTISKETKEENKKVEQNGFDNLHKAQLSKHPDKVDDLKQNQPKAHALIHSSLQQDDTTWS